MSKRKALNREQLIIKIILFSLVPLALFSWYLKAIIHEEGSNDSKHVEAVKTEKKKLLGNLDEPQKPQQDENAEPEKEEENSAKIPKDWWEYPPEILSTTKSGDDLLVLVNKKYKLTSNYAPKDLVSISGYGIRTKAGSTHYLRSILIDDLKEMFDQSKSEEVDMSVISAYRSYSTQASTYQYWVNYNGGNTNAADTVSARAGHSQHQLGTAMDFSSSEIGDRLGGEFTNTKASKWLISNSWKYGFVLAYPKGYESTTGYSYESWHYRYIGKENAQEWKDSGKILEVWLREKNGLRPLTP